MRKILLATLILFSIQLKAQDFWEEVNTPDSINTTFLPINQNDIIIGAGNGILSTNDGGNTWNVDYVGTYYHLSCNYLGSINNNYFADVSGVLYRKTSVAGEWQRISNTPSKAYSMFLMNDSVFFKGHRTGIHKSRDSGYSWGNIFTPGRNESVEAIIQHPDGNLFCGTYSFDQNDVSGVYRSTDTGATWTQTSLRYHMPMALATDSEGNLYAGSWGHWHTGAGGVYKSTDLGVTWDTLKLNIDVRSLVITPGDTIFVGHRNGVSRSVNGGDTWEDLNSGFYYPRVWSLKLGGDGHLYAAINYTNDLLYRSSSAVAAAGTETITIRPEVSVYPNPVSTQLHIRTTHPGKPMRITVMNLQGQIELQQTIALPSSIKVEDLPKGIYILHIQNQTKNFTQKFIKN